MDVKVKLFLSLTKHHTEDTYFLIKHHATKTCLGVKV
jgi:hypothetical protein